MVLDALQAEKLYVAGHCGRSNGIRWMKLIRKHKEWSNRAGITDIFSPFRGEMKQLSGSGVKILWQLLNADL